MQVPFMRNVALVAAANAAIAGKHVKPLWPDYLAFEFYTGCVFVDEKQNIVAADPNGWIAQVKSGARGLLLRHEARERRVDDRMTAGFVGGGARWLIEVVRDGGSEIWEGGDKLGDRNAPDRKIWSAGYVRIAAGLTEARSLLRPISDAIAALDATLTRIAAFARDNAENFVPAFEAAREALGNPAAHSVATDELLPFADLSIEARQLWVASEAAWVFGGMGSWNDMGFDGDKSKLYDELSATLFKQLNDALMLVANSTYPS
jgi:hypothetical protein